MGIEVERRWLLYIGDWPKPDRQLHIRQFYFQSEITERLRFIYETNQDLKVIHCTKEKTSEGILEIEKEFDYEAAEKFLKKHTLIGDVYKTRLIYNHNNMVLEIDKFWNLIPGMGCPIILEIENPPKEIILPNWLKTNRELINELSNLEIATRYPHKGKPWMPRPPEAPQTQSLILTPTKRKPKQPKAQLKN